MQPVKLKDLCSLSQVRRIAAMLDLDPSTFSEGDILPRGWHFFLLAGETRKSLLRQDGFPGLGVPIPDLGLPRLLLGGRTVSFSSDIKIGSWVERTSFVKSINEKTSSAGPMAIVTIQHELRQITDAIPALVETQTYILLSGKSTQAKSNKVPLDSTSIQHQKEIIPDETLLFQYSALGFNSHKIHLDKEYAKNIEGLPGLVVNGGLTALLVLEFIRSETAKELADIKIKHLAPLYCGRKLTITAEDFEGGMKVMVLDDDNSAAVEIEARIK
jgi:3-methylfumaryl-CoA hydratase